MGFLHRLSSLFSRGAAGRRTRDVRAARRPPALERLEGRSLLSSSPAGLGAAGQFAVLGINGGVVDLNGSSVVGDVGLGPRETSTLQKATVTGRFIYDPTATADLSRLNKNVSVSGGVAASDLSQAAADANAASSADAALPPTQTLGDVTASVTLAGNGGTNVVSLRSLTYSSGGSLTLRGGANDVFVVNVAGGFTFYRGQIRLVGGVTADHVLFNFPTAGPLIDLSKSADVIYGTFLAPHRSVNYHDPAFFHGAVIARGISIHSNGDLNFAGFNPPAAPSGLSGSALDEGTGGGLAGVTVTLTTTNSLGQIVVVATATTDVNGAFSFTGLAAASYTITESPPPGYVDDAGMNQVGSAGGSTGSNQFSVTVGPGVSGTGYAFENVYAPA
jgi:hypothetical protein